MRRQYYIPRDDLTIHITKKEPEESHENRFSVHPSVRKPAWSRSNLVGHENKELQKISRSGRPRRDI